ncbi:ProQ/FINO family protein [uncultured Thiothrix sp.]|mgnify:CR=1 FL=1|uniref:ProQ/FINO family protein n=1 Tax=uncultured Thiothrix sp. TaxID=223185 RepID=UPI00261C21A7|nr:ProQ/FINO family protein [uncultured Thiothrix sp.]
MTDTPRKTLTLKRKPAPETISTETNSSSSTHHQPESSPRETRLLGKRIIIRREEAKPSRPNSNNKGKGQAGKNKPPFNKNKEAKLNKPEEPSPSEIQAKAMDRFLADRFEVWLTYKPLALGVEMDLYNLMDQNQPPASKRVVQRLLRMHCNHGKYLQAVLDNQQRYNLAGEALGEISEAEREHATRTLKEQDEKKARQ